MTRVVGKTMKNTNTDKLPIGMELTPLSDEFRLNPHKVMREAREKCPVYYDGQLRDYVVLSASQGRKILNDRTLLSDPRASDEASTRRMRGEDLDAVPPMLHADDPQHSRMRALISKVFTKGRLEKIRPRVKEICHQLINAVEADTFDFVEHIARPLPTIVIAELLGVDSDQHENFKIWSDQIVAATLNPLAPEEVNALGEKAMENLRELMINELDKRRKLNEKSDDLFSALMDVEIAGDRYTDEEILQQTQLLLIAGNQTTTDLVGMLVRNVLETGDIYQRLCREPQFIANAVEESIRFDPPIHSTDRIAPEDMEIDGVEIKKGFGIAVMLAAINHDPALNENPDVFDIDRKNFKHMSFGGGRHFCLGAPLAKMEAQMVLAALIELLPNLKSAGQEAKFTTNPGFRGLDEYWVSKA